MWTMPVLWCVQVVECLQQTSEKEEVTVMRASLTCLAVLFRFHSRFHSSAGTEWPSREIRRPFAACVFSCRRGIMNSEFSWGKKSVLVSHLKRFWKSSEIGPKGLCRIYFWICDASVLHSNTVQPACVDWARVWLSKIFSLVMFVFEYVKKLMRQSWNLRS